MKHQFKSLLLISLMFVPYSASGFQLHHGNLENCYKAVIKKYPGHVLSVEGEISSKKPIYEFDIKTTDGKIIEVECIVPTLKLDDIEQEVFDELQPGFREKAKITLEQAKQIALKKYPGIITEIEFSIEENGEPAYEFDIKLKNRKEYEVEINAVSGLITSVEEEVFQIGFD